MSDKEAIIHMLDTLEIFYFWYNKRILIYFFHDKQFTVYFDKDEKIIEIS